MTETVITTADWIDRLMKDGIILICPRCNESLIYEGLYGYLEVWGLGDTEVHELVNTLRSKGIEMSAHSYGHFDKDDPSKGGKEFSTCESCAREAKDICEESKSWPIGGRD